MSAPEKQIFLEVIQPELTGEIQRVTSDELKKWISEGKLKPTHHVRIKNLSWIEAQNISAFKPLFEIQRIKSENRSNNSDYQQFIDLNLKNNQPPKTPNLPDSSDSPLEPKPDESVNEKLVIEQQDSKKPEGSAAYRLFEVKLTNSKFNGSKQEQNALINKHIENLAKRQKRVLLFKNIGIIFVGIILMGFLSYGTSYIWVYQLKTQTKVDENSVPGLANLSYKLTSDKLDVRLKAAEIDREITDNNRNRNLQPINVNNEITKLETRFNDQRKNLITEYENQLQTTDFTATNYFSFAVLVTIFLLGKLSYSFKTEKISSQNRSQNTELKKANDNDLLANQVIESETEFVQTENPLQDQILEETILHSEINEIPASTKSTFCLFHPEVSTKFLCQECKNYFCGDCLTVVNEISRCCPLCNVSCNNFDEFILDDPVLTVEEKVREIHDSKEIGENKNFVVRDLPDTRTKKIGIIASFAIASLFSAAISMFWVYYLEDQKTEVSQNNKTAQTKSTTDVQQTKVEENSPINNQNSNESCVDPITRQQFKCDEVTRNALNEQFRKEKSVENAQKKTAEKTSLISGSGAPLSSSETTNQPQENSSPNPQNEAKKEAQKQRAITIFIYSFLAIFGLLLLSRLFSKGKK